MNNFDLRSRMTAILLAGAACVSVGMPVAVGDPAPAPEAQSQSTPAPLPNLDEIKNMDELMKVMEQASKDASAKSEEFKQLQDGISAKEKEVAAADQELTRAKQQAEEARRAEMDAKAVVDRLAKSRYRGISIDPLTAIINADGPQNAIDRSAYLTAYTKKAQEALARQAELSKVAAEAHGEASRKQAELNFQISDLRIRRGEMEKQERELKDRIEKIQKRVDGLSKEERERWEKKNGPVAAYSLAGVTGTHAEGMKALEAAMTKLGSPYGWGAAGPTEFDCSGLVVWSYAQQGKTLPRTSQAQMAGGTPVSRADLQPGDVVGYYPGATHVGIYAGNGKLVHASDYGIPVQVVDVDSMPFYGARRY
ncbi:NlpC/P60 family protein [Staphylococcus chromogenes]|nr:NlpC/P60 family protein [Staphylococcus chromogenes]